MYFLGRWLSDALRVALILAGGLLLMQAPALSHDYAAALRQVAEAQGRDIAAREATARGYYPELQAASETELLAALNSREPSNAAGLEQSRARTTALEAALDRLDQSPPVLRPVAALWDLLIAPDAGKRAVAGQAIQSFVPAVQLSAAASAWALIGVIVGSFLAQILLLPAHRSLRRA